MTAGADTEGAPRSAPVIGAVLCGGRSRRFGSDKALAAVGGAGPDTVDETVGGRVVAAMRGGGADPVVAVGGEAGADLAIPTVADLRPGEGPLAALATVLLWAKDQPVLVAPCDLPLLTAGDVAMLVEAGRGRPDAVVIATVEGRPQISLSRWPAGHGRRILGLVDRGERRFMAAIEGVDWVGVEVDPLAVSDADTPEELRRLLEIGRTGPI